MNVHICVGSPRELIGSHGMCSGAQAYLTNLEVYCDNTFVTNVQGDGLLLATPTGSTAYSLAAGGSMVHPSLEGILFTPICPHSLSFRPLVFPDHVQLRVQVPESVRTNELLCSFDGSHHIALMPGDALVVQLCKYPVRLFREPVSGQVEAALLSQLVGIGDLQVQSYRPD